MQILGQRINTGGFISGGDVLTHHVGIVLFEEIIGTVGVHIAERSSAGLQQSAILAVDDLTDHTHQGNAVNRLGQLDEYQRTIFSVQVIIAILTVINQLIGRGSGGQIKVLQLSTVGQGILGDIFLGLIIHPGLLLHRPVGITCTVNIQNTAFGSFLHIQTQHQNSGAGGTGADHTGSNVGANLAIHHLSGAVAHNVVNAGSVDANFSRGAGHADLILTGLSGRKQEVIPILSGHSHISTAGFHQIGIEGQVFLPVDGGSTHSFERVAHTIGNHQLRAGIFGGYGSRQVIQLRAVGRSRLQGVVPCVQFLHRHAGGIDLCHLLLAVGTHKANDHTAGVGLTRTVDHSNLVLDLSGGHLLLHFGTIVFGIIGIVIFFVLAGRKGQRHQGTQRQGSNTLVHTVPPYFLRPRHIICFSGSIYCLRRRTVSAA